jgi:hypothetical protein
MSNTTNDSIVFESNPQELIVDFLQKLINESDTLNVNVQRKIGELYLVYTHGEDVGFTDENQKYFLMGKLVYDLILKNENANEVSSNDLMQCETEN